MGEGKPDKDPSEMNTVEKEGKKAITEEESVKRKSPEATPKSPEGYVFRDAATEEELLALSCSPDEAKIAAGHLEDIGRKETEKYAKASKEKIECGPKVQELKDLINSFEENYPIIDLLLIVDVNEAVASPLRQSAKKDVETINIKINALKKETNISSVELAELQAQYDKYRLAVGWIHKGKFVHTD